MYVWRVPIGVDSNSPASTVATRVYSQLAHSGSVWDVRAMPVSRSDAMPLAAVVTMTTLLS